MIENTNKNSTEGNEPCTDQEAELIFRVFAALTDDTRLKNMLNQGADDIAKKRNSSPA